MNPGHHDGVPSGQRIRVLLDIIAPGSELVAIRPLAGSYSNYTHLVEGRGADNALFRIVTHRYAVHGDCDRGEKARREYRTLGLLQKHGVPAPPPRYLDDDGAILGIPGIVTDYVLGEIIESPADPLDWARSLAEMLVRIHKIPSDADTRGFLLDSNSEHLWFLRNDLVPTYVSAAPDGLTVWHTVRDLLPDIQPVPHTLVHTDYWPGNVLWRAGRISAVVDWEEAGYGDPGADVGYARMNMVLSGLDQAADVFLDTYESAAETEVENLGFWELAAAIRPMIDPVDWQIAQSPGKEVFRRFIAGALARAGR